MIQFHPEIFPEILRAVPEEIPFCEEPRHSDYLQREVFDKLGRGEAIDLSQLDLDAFDLGHTAEEWCQEHYKGMENGWQKGFNRMIKAVQASPRDKRAFF